MPMGTIAHLTNSAGEPAKQNYSSFSAYTNGDSLQLQKWNAEDRISHGDGTGDRPVSQGVIAAGSSSSPSSRSTTGQGPANSMATAAPSGTQSQARPGSSGTDVAPPPAMRHGFAEAYSSEEYLTMLEQVFYLDCRADVGLLHVFHL